MFSDDTAVVGCIEGGSQSTGSWWRVDIKLPLNSEEVETARGPSVHLNDRQDGKTNSDAVEERV